VEVIRKNLRIEDIVGLSRNDFLKVIGVSLDDPCLFVHNFSPELVGLASKFEFSIGFYISRELANSLEERVFPPKLFDVELDRQSLTYAMIEMDSRVLYRSHTSYYDPSRDEVISFSEHGAFPDPVFEDRGVILPQGILALNLHICNSKVTSGTRVKVLVGVQGDYEMFRFHLPKFDATSIFRRDSCVRFMPAVEVITSEYLGDTLVYPGVSTVVYPKSGDYYYSIQNGVKYFIDLKLSKKNFFERRFYMQRAGLLLLPLSEEPIWDFSTIVDLSLRRQCFDMFVDRRKLLNPFRLFNLRNSVESIIEPTIIVGFSIDMQGNPVIDPGGKICISPSGDFKFARTTSDGKQRHKSLRAFENFSFTTLDGTHKLTISVVRGFDFMPASSFYVRYALESKGIPNNLIDKITSTFSLMDMDWFGLGNSDL